LKKDNHNKLIKFGRHTIANWVVIEIDGKKEKIDEFLQGQLTSDIHMIKNNGFQLSSICDHKGFVICDFIIHVNANIYKVVINKELADIFIKELTPFAKFYSVTFNLNDQKVVGYVTNDKSLFYWHNKKYCLGLEIHDKDFAEASSINEDEWILAHKIAKILFLDIESVKKYRPLEINFDNLRVSFDKGCYRGQEIVARMKYLGIDRRKFSTLITKNTYKVNESIKIVGKKIKVNDLQVFNAIIKKDDIHSIINEDAVIDII
jgi:hypothetical protein